MFASQWKLPDIHYVKQSPEATIGLFAIPDKPLQRADANLCTLCTYRGISLLARYGPTLDICLLPLLVWVGTYPDPCPVHTAGRQPPMPGVTGWLAMRTLMAGLLTAAPKSEAVAAGYSAGKYPCS